MHCKLRIAWSVMWGVFALAICVLWVRSYWRLEILEQCTGSHAVQASSVYSRISIARLDKLASVNRSYLNVAAGDAADWRKSGVFGFAYCRDSAITALVAPHWAPALLSAALAVIPWGLGRVRF